MIQSKPEKLDFILIHKKKLSSSGFYIAGRTYSESERMPKAGEILGPC